MSNDHCVTYIRLLNDLFHRFTTSGTYNDTGFLQTIINLQLTLINNNTKCTKYCNSGFDIITHTDGKNEDVIFHLKTGYPTDQELNKKLKTILANHKKICNMGFFNFNNNQVKSQWRSSRSSRASRRARNRSRKAKSRRVNRLKRSRK
jgi:hypothetical protein